MPPPKEFYEAGKKEPPFTPFVVPKFQDKPWLVPLQSHERAAKYWRETVANKTRDPSHQVSLQAWILYLLRFILTGDLRNAWKEFGGSFCSDFSPKYCPPSGGNGKCSFRYFL